MNEDELRAFLDSAASSEGKGKSKDPASEADSEGQAPTHMSFEELMGIKRQEQADPSSPDEGRVAPEPSADRSADSAPSDSTRRASATTGAHPGGDGEELTPIVLPGPPQSPKVNEPFWEPRPTQADPLLEDSAPTALPATAPLSMDSLDDPPADDDPIFGSEPLPAADTGEYEKISVVGSERSHSRFVPWIIVGAGAVLAIVASLVIVFAVRGGEDPQPPPVTEPTAESPAEPTTEEPIEPTAEPVDPEPAPDEPPTVEVGNTGDFNIESWGVQGEISAKFGWPSYTISGDVLTFEGGTLLPQFPESCAAMRTGFGIKKAADGTFEVHRPAETCAEAPDFYNEVWGLTAAIIPTLKPA